MALFEFLKGKQQVKGTIGFFGLADWWLSSFSEEEQKFIQNKFQPLGSSGDSLTSGEIGWTSETAVGLLQSLAGWFLKEDERPIAYKLLAKAEELSKSGARIIDVHFMYGQKLELSYKDREKPGYLEKAIEACIQQINLAPKAADAFRTEFKDLSLPGHKGYQQLAIILEKKMMFKDAIDLCARAQEQGWAGDWEKRIERYKRKFEKA